jgi:hypothetical protein
MGRNLCRAWEERGRGAGLSDSTLVAGEGNAGLLDENEPESIRRMRAKFLSPLHRNVDMKHVFTSIELAVNVLGERGKVGATGRQRQMPKARPIAGRVPPLSNSLPHEEVVQLYS